MKPELDISACIEMGRLRAAATFEDPILELRQGEDQPSCLRLEEGGVVVDLEFPDHHSLARFQRRMATLAAQGGRHE